MNVYIFEFIGTAMLMLIGNGIVANLVLKGTKGPDLGWVGISIGWGIAVFIAVFIPLLYWPPFPQHLLLGPPFGT